MMYVLTDFFWLFRRYYPVRDDLILEENEEEEDEEEEDEGIAYTKDFTVV